MGTRLADRRCVPLLGISRLPKTALFALTALGCVLASPRPALEDLVGGPVGVSAFGSKYIPEAAGDLDCDGTTSLFQRAITIVGPAEIQGAAGLYIENEVE